MIFHINTAKLFPEKDKIADIIKNKFIQNSYLREELTVKKEIESCFKRVSYEIKVSNICDKIVFLRYLRKEREDLIGFLSNQFIEKSIKEDEYNTLKKEIDNVFDFYSHMI